MEGSDSAQVLRRDRCLLKVMWQRSQAGGGRDAAESLQSVVGRHFDEQDV